MYSNGPPHMAKQKQDDQLEHTFNSFVRIRDVALKTCQRRWMIGRSGERGSGISVLAARDDDDDDDDDDIVYPNKTIMLYNHFIYFISKVWKTTCRWHFRIYSLNAQSSSHISSIALALRFRFQECFFMGWRFKPLWLWKQLTCSNFLFFFSVSQYLSFFLSFYSFYSYFLSIYIFSYACMIIKTWKAIKTTAITSVLYNCKFHEPSQSFVTWYSTWVFLIQVNNSFQFQVK